MVNRTLARRVRGLEAQISTTQEQILINVLLVSLEGEVVDELVIVAGDGARLRAAQGTNPRFNAAVQ